MRLDRDIAPGQAGAACRDDHIDICIGAPDPQLIRDLVAFIGQDHAMGKVMARCGDPVHKGLAGFVIRQPAGVADRQHGDAHGDKIAGVVDTAHVFNLAFRVNRSAQASRLAAGLRSR